ncbi:MAG: hypothetical protein IJN57_11415 [Oscillospiraceae bacterium]|nr:hypothetical protein [Oscillospiraceae bacterium]
MDHCNLTAAEQKRRKELVEDVRKMIASQLPVEDQNEDSMMTVYRNYYLQISFSALHPLMVFCLAKALQHPSSAKQRQMTNDLNLHSILGSHAINDEVGCYAYRATHWLDSKLDTRRFFEILDRCVDEADRGYRRLAC